MQQVLAILIYKLSHIAAQYSSAVSMTCNSRCTSRGAPPSTVLECSQHKICKVLLIGQAEAIPASRSVSSMHLAEH
jgi:hypothetical protein